MICSSTDSTAAKRQVRLLLRIPTTRHQCNDSPESESVSVSEARASARARLSSKLIGHSSEPLLTLGLLTHFLDYCPLRVSRSGRRSADRTQLVPSRPRPSY